MYTVGGVDIYVHKYLGPKVLPQDGSNFDATQPAYDAISKILEKDPGSVTINDPLIQKYLQGGTNGTMPMYQFETLLKQDPSWQYTNNAHSQFETLGTDILKRFGMIG